MCGLAGWVVTAGTPADHALLSSMASAIAHRGPDGEGYFECSAGAGAYRVGLAHRRLSILDLEGGHQPMHSSSRALTIVFNGEIYNFSSLRRELQGHGHVFRTRSDTEVILAAYEQWGERCVERLRGMFAFALWDSNSERLFLARDRFGKKPLYVYRRGEAVWFASEIKALLRCPGVERAIDDSVIGDYLTFRYVPSPKTLFAGISKIGAATVASWHDGHFETRRYYSPPDRYQREPSPPPADCVGRFLDELEEAVHIRMVCDVPFGAFLSGGLDSSSVVALMARHSDYPVRTFSVGFREQQYSELDYARNVARLFRTDHHELIVAERDIIEELPHAVAFRDAPVSEPSDIPIYLLSLEARRSVKMVLTGEGADEILGGYPKHVFENWVGAYQRLPTAMRRSVVSPLVRRLPYRFHRVKTAAAAMSIEAATDRLPRWFGSLGPQEVTALYGRAYTRVPSCSSPFDTGPRNSALRRILYFDQVSWLPDNLLERGDSMTMAASLEARMPFVDHELAGFVSSLPDHYRVRGTTTKWILRNAARRLLPPEILHRPKVGFRVPVNQWFRGTLRDYLCDHVLDSNSLCRNLFTRGVLENAVTEHLRGAQNNEKLLWCLLNLEIWHRQYFVQRPAREHVSA